MTGRRQALRGGLCALSCLALALGACGKRGSLKAPAGESRAYTYPRKYPAPDTVLPEGTADSGPASASEDPAPAAEDPRPSPRPFSPSRSKRYGS